MTSGALALERHVLRVEAVLCYPNHFYMWKPFQTLRLHYLKRQLSDSSEPT